MVITRFGGESYPAPAVSPRVLCPLLSYSLSSVSLRDFFGVAHLITVAGQATSSYRNVLLLFFLAWQNSSELGFAHGLSIVVIRCTRCFCCFFPTQQDNRFIRCYTLYLLFLLFSLLSRLHRNNANNHDTLFFRMSHFSLFHAIVFLIDCPWFFLSTCVLVKKIPSNRGEALFLMYHFRS